MRERGCFSTTTLAQPCRPCRPRHPCAVPRTFLQCVCTRRRNCTGQLSPFSEYAPAARQFNPNASAPRLSHRFRRARETPPLMDRHHPDEERREGGGSGPRLERQSHVVGPSAFHSILQDDREMFEEPAPVSPAAASPTMGRPPFAGFSVVTTQGENRLGRTKWVVHFRMNAVLDFRMSKRKR
jgi:hypothetical protein